MARVDTPGVRPRKRRKPAQPTQPTQPRQPQIPPPPENRGERRQQQRELLEEFLTQSAGMRLVRFEDGSVGFQYPDAVWDQPNPLSGVEPYGAWQQRQPDYLTPQNAYPGYMFGTPLSQPSTPMGQYQQFAPRYGWGPRDMGAQPAPWGPQQMQRAPWQPFQIRDPFR